MRKESNIFDFDEHKFKNTNKCNIAERKNSALFEFYTSENKSHTTSVNFKTLTKNLFVTGSVGTGKTKSVLLPIFENLLEDNACGLFFDAKGLIKNDILEIVYRKNRIDDLIFIGIDDNYKKMNLLYNLSAKEVINFFKRKFSFAFQERRNAIWFNWGSNDILQMLLLYEEYYRIAFNNKKPFFTIELINKLCTEKDFVIHVVDFLSKNELSLSFNIKKVLKSVKSELFSIYSALKDDSLIESKLQYGYRTLSILNLINSIPLNIKEKFYSDCISDDDYFDIGDLVFKENKIVVFSGNPEFVNEIAIELKLIKQSFYSSKLNYFSNIKSFLIIDEYQLFISTENENIGTISEINDNDWLSVSREFNHCNIFSTQSVSSLIAATRNENSVYSILQNFVNKICFKTSDLKTINLLFPVIQNGLFLMKLNLGEFVFFTEEENCRSQTYLNPVISYFYDIKNNGNDLLRINNYIKPEKHNKIDNFIIAEYLFSYLYKKRYSFNNYYLEHELFTVDNIYANSLEVVIDLVSKDNNKKSQYIISDSFLNSCFENNINYFDCYNIFNKNNIEFDTLSQKLNSFIHMSYDYSSNKEFFVSKVDKILSFKIKNLNSKLFLFKNMPFIHYYILKSIKSNSSILKILNRNHSENSDDNCPELNFDFIVDDHLEKSSKNLPEELSFFEKIKHFYNVDDFILNSMFNSDKSLSVKDDNKNNILDCMIDELYSFYDYDKSTIDECYFKCNSIDEYYKILFEELNKIQFTDAQKMFICQMKELINTEINISFFLSGENNLPIISISDLLGNELYSKKISGLNIDYDYILKSFNNGSLCEITLFNKMFNIFEFKICK